MKLLKNVMLISKDIKAMVNLSAHHESGIPESWIHTEVDVCAVNEVETLNNGIETQVTIQNAEGDVRLVLEEDLTIDLVVFKALRDDLNEFIDKRES